MGGALLLQVMFAATWYATQPHLSEQSRYFPYVWLVLCGFPVGLLEKHYLFLKAVFLGVLMTIVNTIAHVVAAAVGVPVDLGNVAFAPLMAILVMPISVACSVLGVFSSRYALQLFFSDDPV